MTTIETEILTTFFKDGRDGTEMVPAATIISECNAAEYQESTVRDELASLVEQSRLSEAGNQYAITGAASLSLATHRGNNSTPWQFSLVRTGDELMISQAKAGPDKFDPVLKRFTIEEHPVGDDYVEFHHSVSRRVWQEDPEQPHIRSQRSEGRIFELLYRDPDGWHLARADPDDEPTDTTESTDYEPTEFPGVTVSSTYLRSEEDTEVKYTEDRDYRITKELPEQYATVYVLSYYELNEESHEQAVWKTEDGVAHRLR
jgi:hypothetical protein